MLADFTAYLVAVAFLERISAALFYNNNASNRASSKLSSSGPRRSLRVSMLMRFCLLALGISLTFSAWVEQTNSGNRKWLEIASSSDGTKLAAAVDGDYIYTSSDSGVTWVERSNAGGRLWRGIASSSDGSKLAAVVYSGYIYTSSDSGLTWVEQTNSGNRHWNGIDSSSDSNKLAAAVFGGYIYTSSDSGLTWVEQTNAGSRYWREIASSSDGNKLAAVVYDDGYIYTSADSGVTWVEQTSAGSRFWFTIASSSDNTKLAAALNGGNIYTSTDSGVTWVEQANAGNRFWAKIASSSDGNKLAAVVFPGYIYTSSDSGVTWVEQTNAGSRYWKGISSSSDGSKIAATASDSSIYTINTNTVTPSALPTAFPTLTISSSVWVEQTNSGSRAWIGIASSSDGTKLAAIANQGYIYTSSDSGVTWVERSNAGSPGWFGIASSSDGIKLAATVNQGYIYTSSDSGVTWVALTNAGSRGWFGIASSSDGTKLAAVVFGYNIHTSSDSGLTWVTQTNAGSTGWWGIASSSDGSKLAAIVFGGYIHTSSDSGLTWVAQTNSGSRSWYRIASSSDGTKLAATLNNGGNIYTSSDSGVTWVAQTNAGSREWQGIAWSSDGTRLAAVVSNGNIYTSSDSGVTWVAQTNAGSRTWTGIASSSDGANLAAIVSPGYIYTIDSYTGNNISPSAAPSAAPTNPQVPTQFPSSLDLSKCQPLQWMTTATAFNNGVYPFPSMLSRIVNSGSTIFGVFCGQDTSDCTDIYSSANLGTSWTKKGTLPAANWDYKYSIGISVSEDGMRIAIVGYGASISVSMDGGETWVATGDFPYKGGGGYYATGLLGSNDNSVLLTWGVALYVSKNSGISWTQSSFNDVTGGNGITALAATPACDVILVAPGPDSIYFQGGTVSGSCYPLILSSNYGLSWEELTSSGGYCWMAVAINSDAQIIAATHTGSQSRIGDSGRILISTDGGVTFEDMTPSSSITYPRYAYIFISDDGLRLLAAERGAYPGYLYTSSNSGSTWNEQTEVGSKWWRFTSVSRDLTTMSMGYSASDGYEFTVGSYENCASASLSGPSQAPKMAPTAIPTSNPTASPTVSPTARPTAPTLRPTALPTAKPTMKPTGQPTRRPSGQPTREPSGQPTTQPSVPTGQPSSRPSIVPTSQPSSQPTLQPTFALQTLMSCDVSTGLVGATAASFGMNERAVFSKAMAQSISESSGGKIKIDSTAVTVSSVTDSNNLVMARLLGMNEHCDAIAKTCAASEQRSTKVSLEALLFADGQNQNRYLVGQNGVVVSFQLAVTTQQVGNSNPSTAFTSLSSALSTAVTSGLFNTNLQTAAGSLAVGTSSQTAPLVSNQVFTVTHSAKPTGMPTGQPTTIQCPAGYYHSPNSPSCLVCPAGYYSHFDSSECSRCKPGTFAAAPGSATCTECDKGSYAGAAGMTQCNMCSWPRTTVFPGQRECGAFAINLTFTQQVIFGVVAIVIYLSCCALTRKPELVAFSIFPCLDVMSDLLYLLQNTFYNEAVLIACIVSIVLPNTLFLRLVIKMGALTPHILLPVPAFMEDGTLLWLGYQYGYPLFRGERLSFSFDKHDSILKAVAYWVVWAVCIALQAMCVFILVLLYAPYLAFQIPFCALWLLFGFFLYQIKMMAVGRVWTVWFRVWRRRDNGKHDSTVLIDTGIMNESLFAEFLSETVPQLLLQSINSSACQQLNSGVAIFSISLSVFMTCNGLYRYWYYTYFLGYEMRDVPLEVKIGTTVIRLDHATHNHGGNLMDEKAGKVCDADSQIAFINKDSRFNALVDQLNDPKFFRNELKYLPHKVRLLGLGAPQTLAAIRQRRAKERRRVRELSQQLKRQLSALSSSSTGGANDSDSDSDRDGEGGSSDVELEFEDDGDKDEEEDVLASAEKGNARGGDDVGDEEDDEDVWRDHGHEGDSTRVSGDVVSSKGKTVGSKSGKTRVKGLPSEPSNTPLTRRHRLSLAARRSLTAASTWTTHLARDPIGTLRYNALSMRDSIASRLSGSKGDDGKAKQQRPQPEAASSLSWLDLLDVAVTELGFSKLPVINDLFVHMALKSFSKHGIVSERALHTALVPYAGASGPGREKYALLIAALELDGVFYEHALGSFFETSWSRFQELGKGVNYEWPREEEEEVEEKGKARETVLDAEGGGRAGAGKASEGHETTTVDDIPPSSELALLYPMAAHDQPQRERQADDEAPSSSSSPTDAVAATGGSGSGSPARRPSDSGIRGRAASLLQWRRSSAKPNATAAAAAVVAEEEAEAEASASQSAEGL